MKSVTQGLLLDSTGTVTAAIRSPELIAVVLVNAYVSTSCARAHLSSVPEAALRSALSEADRSRNKLNRAYHAGQEVTHRNSIVHPVIFQNEIPHTMFHFTT